MPAPNTFITADGRTFEGMLDKVRELLASGTDLSPLNRVLISYVSLLAQELRAQFERIDGLNAAADTMEQSQAEWRERAVQAEARVLELKQTILDMGGAGDLPH